LRGRLRELAAEQRRFGYRRLHNLLRAEGHVLNRKKTQRLYREEGLTVRKRKGRKRATGEAGAENARFLDEAATSASLTPYEEHGGFNGRPHNLKPYFSRARHGARRCVDVPVVSAHSNRV
jgi:transposase InsO family protein